MTFAATTNESSSAPLDLSLLPADFTPIPTTVLSGFLGAGKTTLLNHVLANRQGLKVAVIVNDMSEVNIDAALVAGEGHLERGEDRMVELSNGCICCTLREDLVESVASIALSQKFDALLIESTGISEPMPVAATFEWTFENGTSLNDFARIDAMITLVDCSTFLSQLSQGRRLDDDGLQAGEGDERTISDLLADQVEFANRILLTKSDLCDERLVGATEATVRRMNPTADIRRVTNGELDISAVLNTGLYDLQQARHVEGYAEELDTPHTPETEEYGIRSFTYRADRPFDVHRLGRALPQLRGLLRSKGFVWINDNPGLVQVWHQVGPHLQISPATTWERAGLAEGQEIVLIGVGIDEAHFRGLLDGALVD